MLRDLEIYISALAEMLDEIAAINQPLQPKYSGYAKPVGDQSYLIPWQLKAKTTFRQCPPVQVGAQAQEHRGFTSSTPTAPVCHYCKEKGNVRVLCPWLVKKNVPQQLNIRLVTSHLVIPSVVQDQQKAQFQDIAPTALAGEVYWTVCMQTWAG